MENTTPVKKKWKTWQKVLLGIVILFILIGVFSPKSETAASVDSQPVAAVAPTATPVTAAKLFKDYNANEVSADASYKEKLLEVSGKVQSINKDFTDDIYINLAVSEYEHVRCDLSKEATAQAANLQKGQKITMVGEGGTMIMGTPMIKNCIIK